MANLYVVNVNREGEKAAIANFRQEGVIGPESFAQVQYVENEGLKITLTCYEKNPYAIRTEENGSVCRDSCMEAFIDCQPETGKGYFNLEVNSLGVVHCAFGPGRNDRVFLKDLGVPHPVADVKIAEDHWTYTVMMPLSTLEKLYGCDCHFAPGHEMKGNFYKCIEDGSAPHWAAWNAVSRLDFHAPHDFGTLKIEG